MHFYCEICDKEFKTDLKNTENLVNWFKHTINNPKLSDIGRLFFEYVIIHNKTFDLSTIDVIFQNEFETKDF